MNHGVRLALLLGSVALSALAFASCGGRSLSERVGGAAGGDLISSAGAAAMQPGAGTAGIDWAACEPGDSCQLESQTACGFGCEPVDPARFIPVNGKYDALFRKLQPVPPCIDLPCDPIPGTDTLRYYFGECIAGRCRASDVRTSAVSACKADADCYLRGGTTCCGCGGPLDTIAVSHRADAELAFCGARGHCAEDCSAYPDPPGYAADCVSGHCAVYSGGIDGGIEQ